MIFTLAYLNSHKLPILYNPQYPNYPFKLHFMVQQLPSDPSFTHCYDLPTIVSLGRFVTINIPTRC